MNQNHLIFPSDCWSHLLCAFFPSAKFFLFKLSSSIRVKFFFFFSKRSKQIPEKYARVSGAKEIFKLSRLEIKQIAPSYFQQIRWIMCLSDSKGWGSSKLQEYVFSLDLGLQFLSFGYILRMNLRLFFVMIHYLAYHSSTGMIICLYNGSL